MAEHVLTLVCRDRVGIVHAVAGYLTERDCNILDSQQFGDPDAGRFFMRVHFAAPEPGPDVADLRCGFQPVAGDFDMTWQIYRGADKCRTLVLVSRYGHCLNDLLYRWRTGALPIEIPGIVSNHPDFASLAGAYGVPFHHLAAAADNRVERESRMLELIDRYQIDLVVLARYMQVMSDDFCHRMSGRVINIHHSFLPSFKGARPHQQAHDRGVKLIGATAHYVTADLDEGPIIEQEIARVDHSFSVERLAAVGRDVEALALARAVQAHAEHRVLLNGSRTVVFR